MSVSQKRATVYFDPDIHKALKIKSLETSKSLSELVNRAVKELLAEDAEDIDDIEKRADDKHISYAELVKRLKKDGRI